MDFYTLKTTVDLTAKEIFDEVAKRITHLAQMELIGKPFKEGEDFIFRFAVRAESLIGKIDHLKDLLVHSIEDMTHENVSVDKADTI